MEFIPIASSSKGNAYLVKSPGVAPLLIECGIPVRQLREKLSFGLSGLAGCLVSHCHADHSKAVKDLLKTGIDCFMSQECAEALKIEEHYRVHPVVSGKQFIINGFWIIPVPLEHDVVTQGFVIASPDGDGLVFIPDTSFVRNRFEGFTHLAIECNHLSETLSKNIQDRNIPATVGRRIRHSHMSLKTTINFLKANDLSKCRHIYLLHLSDSNSDEARMIKAVQEAVGIPTTACGE